MVGEIRDQETAALATNAALTGHLVLSTLHTNSAAGAVPRLLDIGVQPFLLTSTIKVIIGQRLVRTLCPEKEQYTLSDKEIESLRKVVDVDVVLAALKNEGIVKPSATWNAVPVYRPKKSQECATGYKGRIGLFEVLEMTPAIEDLVISNAPNSEIEAQAIKEGMILMRKDALYKAATGDITIEEAIRAMA